MHYREMKKVYLYTGSPPPFLYQITVKGGFFGEGADVLQRRYAVPPNTLILCSGRKTVSVPLSPAATLTSAVTYSYTKNCRINTCSKDIRNTRETN